MSADDVVLMDERNATVRIEAWPPANAAPVSMLTKGNRAHELPGPSSAAGNDGPGLHPPEHRRPDSLASRAPLASRCAHLLYRRLEPGLHRRAGRVQSVAA